MRASRGQCALGTLHAAVSGRAGRSEVVPDRLELDRAAIRGLLADLDAELVRREARYTATTFLGMVSEHGGIETARRLLHASTTSDGFAGPYERGRLDLTVEAVVIGPRFRPLFTDDELATAQERLDRLGYSAQP